MSTVTCGAWHPLAKEQFITASLDSTVRLWEMETAKKKSLSSAKCRGKTGEE